jgi:hypothetical protein
VDGFDAGSSVHNLTIPPFTAGTTDPVSVEFNADCCVRTAKVTVFDVAGNDNFTAFDQGPMRGETNFFLQTVGFVQHNS